MNAISTDETATVYKAYPDKHESRKQYRLSTRETLRAMVKEKQQQIKQLCTEVSELRDHINILDAEEEHSSEEEVNKFIKGAMDREVEIVDTPEDIEQNVNTQPSLFLMSGPKMYIQIQFDLKEFKPYTLSCQIDSGCQVNLAKGSALPFYYWEKTFGSGTAIHGTPVPIRGKAEIVPVVFGKAQSKLTFYRLDELKDDCLLGSDFLH